jgi:hypothetical protein
MMNDYFNFAYKYILSLIYLTRVNFSEQHHIEIDSWDARSDEKSREKHINDNKWLTMFFKMRWLRNVLEF